MRMRTLRGRAVLFVALLTSAGLASASDIAIHLRRHGAHYAVEIVNTSHDIVRINHDMSMAPVIGQLQFRVFKRTEELGMRGDVNASMATEKSYVSLLPGQYFGGLFDADLLQAMYGMSGGCYSIDVTYFDSRAGDFHGYDKKVTSNRLKVCVP